MVMLSTRIDHLEHDAKRRRGEDLNRFLTVSLQEYKFTPPPPQWDPVIRHVKLIIRELNREYIGFASLHVRVDPTNESGPFWPVNPRFPLYDGKLYTFVMDDGNEFPICAAEVVGSNGKTFRLFDLPLEIRNTIYEFALGIEIHPLSIFDDQREVKNVVLGAGYSRKLFESSAYRNMGFDKAIPEGSKYVPRPTLALLQTCSQVHDEALPTAWISSVKCFDDKQLFLTLADSHISPHISADRLNKIQLNLAFKQWFDFFGIVANPDITIDPATSSADALAQSLMPNLKYLELRFRSPHDGGKGNPWEGHLNTAGYLDCCQRDMVDMVCTFAFPHITWIPNVRLVGYVKNASKKKWESVFESEWRGGRHRHDQDAAMAAILNAPGELSPPKCTCSESCATNVATRWYEEHHSYKVDVFDSSDRFKFDELEDHLPSKIALWQAAYEAEWRKEQTRVKDGGDVEELGVGMEA